MNKLLKKGLIHLLNIKTNNLNQSNKNITIDYSIDKIDLQDIMFKTGSSDLDADQKKIIISNYNQIKDRKDIKIILSGHADKTGNEDINLLSHDYGLYLF